MNSTYSQQPSDQPEILLQLRQKSAQLRQDYAALKDDNKQLNNQFNSLSDRLNVLLREKEIQDRKSRSLMLLVSDIQRQLDDTYMDANTEEEPQKLEGQNRVLREILVKVSEVVKEDQKLLSFMRQTAASGPKAAQFVQRSRYLQGQTELLAKLRSQIGSFVNDNLQCSRKWNDLERQTQRLEKEQGLLRIQTQRLKRDLKEQYEDYLERLNRSKACLVNYNQTQREKVVTEYLIEQMALLQEKRFGVQQQLKNLTHHQESLLEEHTRLQVENKELKSFFNQPNSNQQNRLATKMKLRIEQLKDCLSEIERTRNLPQLPISDVCDLVKARLRTIEESQGYIEKKVRQQEQGKVVIQEKDVLTFFEGVLRGRDEKIQIAKEREQTISQRLRETSVKRQLLSSQIDNLEEGLKYHHYENVGTRMAGLSSLGQETQVSKWRRDNRETGRMAATNLLTTTSKYVA